MRERRPDETVAMFFDFEDLVRGRTADYITAVTDETNAAAWSLDRIVEVSFVQQKKVIDPAGFVGVPGLQAADLLAFDLMTRVHQHRPPVLADHQIGNVRAYWLEQGYGDALIHHALTPAFAGFRG